MAQIIPPIVSHLLTVVCSTDVRPVASLEVAEDELRLSLAYQPGVRRQAPIRSIAHERPRSNADANV